MLVVRSSASDPKQTHGKVGVVADVNHHMPNHLDTCTVGCTSTISSKAYACMITAMRPAILALYCLLTPAIAAEPKTPFKCERPFGRETSHATLARTFGAANATIEDVGEFDEEVTILFPNDPMRRLMVRWRDQKGRRGLRSVIIRGPRSSWSVAGIAIGTPLVELERLNGRPFKLITFEGDYGGAIIDWRGGYFDRPLAGGCRFGGSVWIKADATSDESRALEKETAPERTLLSSGEGLRAMKPAVVELLASFPE
jgi:hypothetical protein